MDSNLIPYSPIMQRPPLRWPNGARVALMITTNLEYLDPLRENAAPYYPGGPSIITLIGLLTSPVPRAVPPGIHAARALE